MDSITPLPVWFGQRSIREELDPIIDEYEQRWRELGSRPSHHDFLDRCSPESRESLLDELKYCDRYYLKRGVRSSGTGPRALDHEREIPEAIGSYQIIKHLGIGGFGVVFLAFDSENNRQVALKIPHPSWLIDKKPAEILHEAHVLEQLVHPNIVQVLDSGCTDNGCFFLATEWIDGMTLHEVLAEASLSVKQSVDLAIQVAEGLQFAHQQEIVHRDIKPRNIMLDELGHAKILDYGLAKILDIHSASHTASGVVKGTLNYISPEQASGRSTEVDQRTDVYSLGLVLLEMLVGHRAFVAARRQRGRKWASPRLISPSIPKEIDRICRKATATDREKRYQTIGQMARDLKQAANSQTLPSLAVMPDLSAASRSSLGSAAKYWSPVVALALFIASAVGFSQIDWPNMSDSSAATRDAETPPVYKPPTTLASLDDEQPRSPRRNGNPTKRPNVLPEVIGELPEVDTRSFFSQLGTAVSLATEPKDAKVFVFEFDDQGVPARDSQRYLGRSPLNAWLPGGDYFVVVVLDDGRFHEVFRRVPRPNEIPLMHSPTFWKAGDLGFALPAVSIPEFVPSDMALVNGVWIDERVLLDKEFPRHTDFGVWPTAFEGKRVNVQNTCAKEYFEKQGKRLPFLHELQAGFESGAISRLDGLSEWTATIAASQAAPITGVGVFRTNSIHVANDGRVFALREFERHDRVGQRGARSQIPFSDLN